MDIYRARQLQKILYKASDAGFKRMKTLYINGKLIYIIIHQISGYNAIQLPENFQRIKEDIDNGILAEIRYIVESYNIPSGMYIMEKIEID